MTEKGTTASLQADLEGTTRSRTPFSSRTPRVYFTKHFIFKKRHSLIPELSKKNLSSDEVIKKLYVEKAIENSSNTIAKEIIAGISAKIIKLKEDRRLKLFKQKEFNDTLEKQRDIYKYTCLEEMSIIKELNDIGKERVRINNQLKELDDKIWEAQHQLKDKKYELKKRNETLNITAEELEEQKINCIKISNDKRSQQMTELNKILEYKQNIETENRVAMSLLKELEEKNHLAIVKEGKLANELKDRVKEITSILSNV